MQTLTKHKSFESLKKVDSTKSSTYTTSEKDKQDLETFLLSLSKQLYSIKPKLEFQILLDTIR